MNIGQTVESFNNFYNMRNISCHFRYLMHVIIYAGTDPDLPKDGWGSYYTGFHMGTVTKNMVKISKN
jgi:hypothetical protein